MKKEDWYLLQEWVAEQLREIDPYARSTKGSGNSTEKGDLKLNNAKLHIECKCYQKKNVWNIDWLQKCSEEIVLHSNKIPIVITENINKEKIAHVYADDFLNLYKKLWKLEHEN